jgi:uncharacterized protein (TIGR03000 family)
MHKFLTVVAIAGFLSLGVWAKPAVAQPGRGPATARPYSGSGSGVYYYRFRSAPTAREIDQRNYDLAHTYPYNTASETFTAGLLDYFLYGDTATMSSPYWRSGPQASYGADTYAILRQSQSSPGGDVTRRGLPAPNPSANQATVRVTVPDPDARVYFDDELTRQTGPERTFNSPPLDPSKSYTYTVRATWTENGREVSRSQDVKVQAGREAAVDFREKPPIITPARK